jgi:hypothetical protein
MKLKNTQINNNKATYTFEIPEQVLVEKIYSEDELLLLQTKATNKVSRLTSELATAQAELDQINSLIELANG